MTTKFVAYYRVSTDRQGASGYGLEAQRRAVLDYVGAAELVEEFTEVESGKRNDRPELARALAAAKRHKATLIIAKVDRLARNAAFLLSVLDGLGKGGVVFCDLPVMPAGPAGRFVLTMLAAVAEFEGGVISERVKAALASAKIRGVKLGNEAQARANEEAARGRAAEIKPVLLSLADLSARAAASIMNQRGVPTPTGAPWSAKTVIRARGRVGQ